MSVINANDGVFFMVLLAISSFVVCFEKPEGALTDEIKPVSMKANEDCAKFSKWPEYIVDSEKVQSSLGRKCIVRSGSHGRQMYNEQGKWDCLQCCANHFWNGKECEPCPPGSQSHQGVFESCMDYVETSPPETDPPKPKAPSGKGDCSCSLAMVKVENHTSNSADVAWDPFCKECEDVGEIEIAIHEDDTGMTMLMKKMTVDPSIASYSLNNLKPGRKYCVEIRALTLSRKVQHSKEVRFQTNGDLEDDSSHKKTTATESHDQNVNQNTPSPIQVGAQDGSESSILVDVTDGLETGAQISLHVPHKGKYKVSVAYVGDDNEEKGAWSSECVMKPHHDVTHDSCAWCWGSCFIIILVVIVLATFCMSCKVSSNERGIIS